MYVMYLIQNTFYYCEKTKKTYFTNKNCFAPELNIQIVTHCGSCLESYIL